MVERLEESDPELAEFIGSWCKGKSEGRKLKIDINGDMFIRKRFHRNWEVIGQQKNIGRNDPCPYCLENGVTIKWKKCKVHNA